MTEPESERTDGGRVERTRFGVEIQLRREGIGGGLGSRILYGALDFIHFGRHWGPQRVASPDCSRNVLSCINEISNRDLDAFFLVFFFFHFLKNKNIIFLFKFIIFLIKIYHLNMKIFYIYPSLELSMLVIIIASGVRNYQPSMQRF